MLRWPSIPAPTMGQFYRCQRHGFSEEHLAPPLKRHLRTIPLNFPANPEIKLASVFMRAVRQLRFLPSRKPLTTQRVRFQNSCNVPPTVFKLSVCLELAMATELKNLPPCSVCNKPVCLESATTDEQGRIVHDKCYFLKIISAKPTPTNREQFGKSGSRE